MTSPKRPATPVRAFVDANVLYSAALGGGIARLWRCPGLVIVTSNYAALEAFENLGDEPDADRCRGALSVLLADATEVVASPAASSLANTWNLPDPGDVPILAAAIASGCTYLVTGDKKCFGRFFDGPAIDGVRIVRTGEFLRRAESGDLA